MVWINGDWIGENRGGYTPFSFDITGHINPGESGELVLAVWDPTDAGYQPVGKQSFSRTGYRYTPTTGIWQTVWIEAVPQNYVKQLNVAPNIDRDRLDISVDVQESGDDIEFEVTVMDKNKPVASDRGSAAEVLSLQISDPKLWCPETPNLYDLNLRLYQNGRLLDSVGSYCAFRKVSVGKDQKGHLCILLNDKPIFQFGPLDQGYWPDGILTPPSDEAQLADLRYLKDVGCNMVRSHVKVQPDSWYAHCDRLGLLVWQDTVCTFKDLKKSSKEHQTQWEEEQFRMIRHLMGHPAIINWILYNEGWGQHDTKKLTDQIKQIDPSRLITGSSGWWDREVGDIYDMHNYSFHPVMPVPGDQGVRAVVIGEAGGFEYLVPGHVWPNLELKQKADETGDARREGYESLEMLEKRYRLWAEGMLLLKAYGLNAIVYTQITDVEHEPNGWMTYDREVSKLPIETWRSIHSELYADAPDLKVIAPPAGRQTCRITSDDPGLSWQQPQYNDSGWQESEKGVGLLASDRIEVPTANLPLYLRCSFELINIPEKLIFRFWGNGTAEISLHGVFVKRVFNERVDYPAVADIILPVETKKHLRSGKNLLAVKITPDTPKPQNNIGLRNDSVRLIAIALLEYAC